LVEEPEDPEVTEETIMTEEVNGFGRGKGRGGGGNNGGGRGNNGGNRDGDSSFGFPIVDEDSRATMKNISPSVLPNFHGLRNEDPETFLFEFEVVCRTYDYLEDSKKLKLFPLTLKGAALKWFMGLLTQSIRTWNDMKQTFLDRYLDYCMPTNHKDEVFKMVQREDENLEDLLERFQYNLKRAKMSNLDEETLKALLLKAIRDELIDILNMMGKGDISQLPLHDIAELCVHLSRGKSKTRKGPRDPSLIRANKSTTGSVSRAEIGNMLDEFKTDILGSLSEQLDTLRIKNKQKAEAEALAIFFPKCRKKHALRECPLDAKVVETCMICSENHETKDCPSIPGLKAVFQEDPNSMESLHFVASRPWQGQQNKGFNNSMNFQTPPNWNPWQQSWFQPQNPFQSSVQGMKNPYGRFAQFYQYPGLLRLNSFIVFARIGISLMACNKGILIQTFFNSSRKS